MEDTGGSTSGAPLASGGGRRPARPGVIATLVMVVVFAFGVMAGVALDRHLLHGRQDGRERRDGFRFVPGTPMPAGPRTPPAGVDSMRRRGNQEFARALGLTPDQATAVDSVMRQDFQTVNALREEMRPRIDAIIAGTRQRIDSLLTPAQREKYHALLAEQEKRMQRERGERGEEGNRRGGRPF
jgi:Spy/CpxP family protein refolding chaperone